MLTLCIDTAYKYLTVCLIKDNELVGQVSYECFKKQSEEVFVALDKLFKDTGINKSDVDSMCITKGPGSYTGVRIAMTIAKVYSKIRSLDLYTISTLRLYAGKNSNVMVIMDARANRAYVGVYDKENIISEDHIEELDKIDSKDYSVVLDGSLINKENISPDIPKCFIDTKKYWDKVDSIDFLTPTYLKESDAYYR